MYMYMNTLTFTHTHTHKHIHIHVTHKQSQSHTQRYLITIKFYNLPLSAFSFNSNICEARPGTRYRPSVSNPRDSSSVIHMLKNDGTVFSSNNTTVVRSVPNTGERKLHINGDKCSKNRTTPGQHTKIT